MAAPVFEDSSSNQVDLEHGITAPYHDAEYQPNQSASYTRAGQRQATEWNSDTPRYWRISVHNISKTTRDNLNTFFERSTVRWGLKTFTFYPTGTSGTSYTVNLAMEEIGENISFPLVRTAGLYNIDELILREEIT